MTTDRLEWLELSAPAAAPKSVPPPNQTPCPACGWPLPPQADTCPHCQTGPAAPPLDGLAGLGLEFPPPAVTLAPAPSHWLKPGPVDSPALYHLRLQAEQLRTAPGFDRLICLDDINVDHYQHQLEAALRALRDMRGRALLADEVGLGKTIEAGIVMKELIERGLVKSVLIITPAALTHQWREEMRTKFFEPFTLLERPAQLPDPVEDGPCRWLISLARAKSARWAQSLLARPYDLLIVDEAHKLKNHQTQAYKFVAQIKARYVLLLTATPVHNNLLELYNLVSLLKPGHLGTHRAFRDSFVQTAGPRPPPRAIYSSAHPLPYLRKSQADRAQLRQSGQFSIAFRTQDFAQFDRLRLNRAGRRAAAQVQQLLQSGYEVFDFEAVKGRFWTSHQFVCRLKLARADDGGPAPPPQNGPGVQNPLALRRLLREVMIRNRRAGVGVRFPPRRAAIYAFNLTPPERDLYNQATAYIRAQLRQAQNTDPRAYGALKMGLMALQKQLCSSPQAAARALRGLARRRPQDATLAHLLVLAWGIGQSRKFSAVLELLAQHPGKFLIFTDYLPTLKALQHTLEQAGIDTVVFHGGLSTQGRVEVVRQFRGPARVMVSTQSGSEGHNLQFCRQLINFDLPWNPMRIEQRVGRLHRLGQSETVQIFNLAAHNTIEAYILDLLARKIRMFELVIGELDLVLGQLDDQRSFEQRIEDAWAASQSEEELLTLLAQVEGMLGQAQTVYQSVRSASDELSDLLDAFDEVYPS